MYSANKGTAGHAFIDRALYLPRQWTDDRPLCEAADEVYGRDRHLCCWLESRYQPFVLAIPKDEKLWWRGWEQKENAGMTGYGFRSGVCS
ncbi:hypothetical protein PSI14_15585 [Xenorhabdus sp. XENO-2]|uniref:Transposase n=1 Tax=Xenorhabdus anantnagensis TaxID=3025875 RepID=A0ABT5LWM9_9GAMM|nr:hypothetical protein [Xenorhabdus anantnagensis]MDC9598223.1 hypothetical protein [Xenorhabdus anantnagensis]